MRAILADGLGKEFRIGTRGASYGSLRDVISVRTEQIARRLRSGARTPPAADDRLLQALHDVSFSIDDGEVVGIIGRNGAGKSTLLKILARITLPSEGRVEISGRVGSLLEVGTGFHGELTGRENVYLNGAILGMRKAEIDRRFDEIVAFSEVERFLDTPVKRYSSGMTVRLAFAVAAHLEPEILLVDEVLAVGDLAFQRKCIGKMGEVAREGRTVLFVSHNMGIVQALCERGILLNHGTVVADAPVHDAVGAYLRTLDELSSVDFDERRDRRGWQQLRLVSLEFTSEEGPLSTGRPAQFVFRMEGEAASPTCRFTIFNQVGNPITTFSSADVAGSDEIGEDGQTFVCHVDTLPLVPGRYRVDVELRGGGQIQDAIEAAAFFDVEEGALDGRPVVVSSRNLGDVAVSHRWTTFG
jgi:lipopolysaccharide transport system ATP-binding protein